MNRDDIRQYIFSFIKGITQRGWLNLKYCDPNIKLPLRNLPEHEHTYHTGSLPASSIYVTDTAEHFSSHNLEEILAEIYSLLGAVAGDSVIDESGNSVINEGGSLIVSEDV